MSFLQGLGYKLDIVFVIDATGSMGPIMQKVKGRALELGDEIKNAMKDAGKPVKELRMRVVDFADYAYEYDDAIRQTDFFVMDEDKEKFEDAINGIEYERRGGDDPENGLEALYTAMLSDWVTINAGEKGRHIIVVMTDAYPLHLHERDGSVGYPSDDIPENIAALEEIWNMQDDDQKKTTTLSASGQRLLLFVPDGKDKNDHTWADVVSWQHTATKNVDAKAGLADLSLDGIIAEIVKSC